MCRAKTSVATDLAYEPNFVSPNFDDRIAKHMCSENG
jgi:hypothetical protein